MDSYGPETGFQHMVDRRCFGSCRRGRLLCTMALQRHKPRLQQGMGHIPRHPAGLCKLLEDGAQMDVLCVYGFHLDDILAHGGKHGMGCAVPQRA